MIQKKIHFYSAYLKKGGANNASNSLFEKLNENMSEFIISRSTFYENQNFTIKPSLMRILGKIISFPTYQSQAYIPFDGIIKKKESINFDIVHTHWINNIPLNSIPSCKNLIITAHDQWITNNCWAWDPKSLNSPSRKIETTISNSLKIINKIKSPLDYLSENYPLRKIIAPSFWLKEYLLSKSKLPSNKIEVVNNIINSSKFFFNEETHINYLNQDKIIIVSSTAYWQEWRKGKELLMQILRSFLKLKNKKVEFRIIGKIDLDDDLKEHAVLYGQINNNLVISNVLNSSTCLIMPSRLENLTQTICEGLFCGLPVLAFDVGGNNEILNNEKLGYLFKYPETRNFIDYISYLFDNDSLEKRRERANYAIKKFSNPKIIEQHLKIYKEYL